MGAHNKKYFSNVRIDERNFFNVRTILYNFTSNFPFLVCLIQGRKNDKNALI